MIYFMCRNYKQTICLFSLTCNNVRVWSTVFPGVKDCKTWNYHLVPVKMLNIGHKIVSENIMMSQWRWLLNLLECNIFIILSYNTFVENIVIVNILFSEPQMCLLKSKSVYPWVQMDMSKFHENIEISSSQESDRQWENIYRRVLICVGYPMLTVVRL